MNICIYFEERSQSVIEILPKNLKPEKRNAIEHIWSQEIPRKVLIALSSDDKINASQLRQKIGHSVSTIHENIKKLEDLKLIQTKVVYEGNKQRIITPNVLCVTHNPKQKAGLQKFFQGLWIDSKKTSQIIEFLKKNPDKEFTREQISLKTKIPVDEVELLLSNWDSVTTRGLSHLLKEPPFEKKVLYRAKKSSSE